MREMVKLNKLSPELRDKIKRQIILGRRKEQALLEEIAQKNESERLLWMDSLTKAKAIRGYLNILKMKLWQIENKKSERKESIMLLLWKN